MNNSDYIKSLRYDTYDTFRDNIITFISHTKPSEMYRLLSNDLIEYFWKNGEEIKSFYLLGLLDYYTDKTKSDIIHKYDKMRLMKSDILIMSLEDRVISDYYTKMKQDIIAECSSNEVGKYFIKYNIAERKINIFE